MNNFAFYNPVKIIFGKNTISQLVNLLDSKSKIMLLYGGGSIKNNGVYDQIKEVLGDRLIQEFGGIEPNPDYSTLIKAVEICRSKNIDFLLSAGGGSVIDGTKFIAAAACYTGDPWDLLSKKSIVRVNAALPLGTILTLAATGSEMNDLAVISRRETGEKLSFRSPLLFPQFSILDPETTYSLDKHQLGNGIVDALVHVCEQYLTYDTNTPLQDRQCEALLKTLIEIGETIFTHPLDYHIRANLMWCATQSLNGMISCGTPQDWSTHMIGHEITALYGLDHARSLAVVWPAVIRHQKIQKFEKFVQFGRRVWHIEGDDEFVFEAALNKTVEFFKFLGFYTTLKEYGIDRENFEKISSVIEKRNGKIGEKKNIGSSEIKGILELCRK